mgnify:CR=1 FL=1
MTIGKTRGLSRLATANGHFTMVAVDQRPPLIAALAERLGVRRDEVPFPDMLAAKRLLVQALAGEASAMLLDPNYAVPAALDLLPPRSGLVLTLEDHRFEETPGGRRSRAIAGWNVAKIRRMGGDAVKVLAWYRPDAAADIVAHQKSFIGGIGEQCRRHDIPYVLELLVYPFLRSAGHTTDDVESRDKLPELVIESVREFADPRYGVDLFKLESPLPAASLPPRDGGKEAQAAQSQFDRLGAVCDKAGIPWVLLSAAAPPDQFARVLAYAYAAGASGFLAGRTIWLDAISRHYPDKSAVSDALRRDGRKTLHRLNALTDEKARPWTPSYSELAQFSAEGEFARAYSSI